MSKPKFTLEFTDERDFVLSASAILGTAYVNGSDAVSAIGKMPKAWSFGPIQATEVCDSDLSGTT